MHTCIHAYMHTCIHADMHTCIHAYMHTCIQTIIQWYVTYIPTHVSTYIQLTKVVVVFVNFLQLSLPSRGQILPAPTFLSPREQISKFNGCRGMPYCLGVEGCTRLYRAAWGALQPALAGQKVAKTKVRGGTTSGVPPHTP